jgi:hypothetical protein
LIDINKSVNESPGSNSCDNYYENEIQLLPLQYIQMELFHFTLYDAINEMNKTLNQCKEKGISLIGYYISQELRSRKP